MKTLPIDSLFKKRGELQHQLAQNTIQLESAREKVKTLEQTIAAVNGAAQVIEHLIAETESPAAPVVTKEGTKPNDKS